MVHRGSLSPFFPLTLTWLLTKTMSPTSGFFTSLNNSFILGSHSLSLFFANLKEDRVIVDDSINCFHFMILELSNAVYSVD